MAALFLLCAVFGGSILVIQLVLGLFGIGFHAEVDHGGHHGVGEDVADGLNLFTVRGLAAAVAFFGIAGRAALALGLGTVPASLLGIGTGVVAAVGVAAAMRLLRNFDSDGAVRIDGAVGRAAQVHVKIPGGRGQLGKVMLTLQEREVEVLAVSLDGELATGTPVTVVGVADGGVVEVVRTPD
jgi:hypothetical protein